MQSRVRIKICGITNKEDALLAVKFGADALGFIFSESKRKITVRKAKEIILHIPPFITCVGVFVNETYEKIEEILSNCRIDAIQLHGDESPHYCRRFSNKALIKAFHIKDKKSLENIAHYKKINAILLDTFAEGSFGGTGKTFDWSLAVGAKKFGKPLILSGGLTYENVGKAISMVKPFAVDVCSGVEKYPGKKDEKKLKRFIEEVRRQKVPLLLYMLFLLLL